MIKQVQNSTNPYAKMAREGAAHYDRPRHLPALLALWPSELEDLAVAGTKHIIHQLEFALLAERRRGRARHWCYDLNRHLALVSALKGEQKHLARIRRKSKPCSTGT